MYHVERFDRQTSCVRVEEVARMEVNLQSRTIQEQLVAKIDEVSPKLSSSQVLCGRSIKDQLPKVSSKAAAQIQQRLPDFDTVKNAWIVLQLRDAYVQKAVQTNARVRTDVPCFLALKWIST